MNDLEGQLQAISISKAAKEEATRIAAAIQNTYRANATPLYPQVLSLKNQKRMGYYCYEWAYAFHDAFKHESSGKCFSAQLQAYGDATTGKVHAFIAITSLETGRTIYVDDGFMNGSWVHTAIPIGGKYKDEFELVEELSRGRCNIPQIRDHRNRTVSP